MENIVIPKIELVLDRREEDHTQVANRRICLCFIFWQITRFDAVCILFDCVRLQRSYPLHCPPCATTLIEPRTQHPNRAPLAFQFHLSFRILWQNLSEMRSPPPPTQTICQNTKHSSHKNIEFHFYFANHFHVKTISSKLSE